jgi:SNF2 family DNA or RNA helicase
LSPSGKNKCRRSAGAKIDALVEHVLALREEGHRALVFTQFLTSMALLREAFMAAGIEFLELDGATPAAERARRADAFQAGEGDVFVLSLRAGGVGMNLTGADYVLHLDPWWNPAVEDQATDRAHRIGQSRPVTVYRLISKGTIEEKILALHADKRDLADDLLTGLEGSGALELDELVGLLSD